MTDEVRICIGCGVEMHRSAFHYFPSAWKKKRYCTSTCAGGYLAKRRAPPIKDRLKNVKRNKVTGCLEWQGLLNTSGYGALTVSGRKLTAHRLSYQEFVGPIPPGKHVLHRCDNPRCIDPKHLFLGDNTTNTADRDAKGRQARGERAGRAKLTTAKVRLIRASKEPHSVLAERFGVGPGTISGIRNRRIWTHVQ